MEESITHDDTKLKGVLADRRTSNFKTTTHSLTMKIVDSSGELELALGQLRALRSSIIDVPESDVAPTDTFADP